LYHLSRLRPFKTSLNMAIGNAIHKAIQTSFAEGDKQTATKIMEDDLLELWEEDGAKTGFYKDREDMKKWFPRHAQHCVDWVHENLEPHPDHITRPCELEFYAGYGGITFHGFVDFVSQGGVVDFKCHSRKGNRIHHNDPQTLIYLYAMDQLAGQVMPKRFRGVHFVLQKRPPLTVELDDWTLDETAYGRRLEEIKTYALDFLNRYPSLAVSPRFSPACMGRYGPCDFMDECWTEKEQNELDF